MDNHNVCWHLQVIHHSSLSRVVQDFVHAKYVSLFVCGTSSKGPVPTTKRQKTRSEAKPCADFAAASVVLARACTMSEERDKDWSLRTRALAESKVGGQLSFYKGLFTKQPNNREPPPKKKQKKGKVVGFLCLPASPPHTQTKQKNVYRASKKDTPKCCSNWPSQCSWANSQPRHRHGHKISTHHSKMVSHALKPLPPMKKGHLPFL